jgi:hypothetical protein
MDGCKTNAATIDGATALVKSAENGQMEILKLLLDARCDVKAKTKSGTTALMTAYQYGHANILEALLTRGAYSPIPPGYPRPGRPPTNKIWLVDTLMLCFSPTLFDRCDYTYPYYFRTTPFGDEELSRHVIGHSSESACTSGATTASRR